MYRYDELRVVHLELTSRCNAACPLCPRNVAGGEVNPRLPLAELSLKDVQRLLEPELVARLGKVMLCGNYGDPAVASDCLDVVRYLRQQGSSLDISLHTNGGVRRPEWWAQLAEVVSDCKFGIDGLEDTNHLYRQRVEWSRLLANVKAFIAAGGVADWVFLAFAHNQHQIEQARALSEELGFRRFILKRSSRFPIDESGRRRLVVRTARGEASHVLEPATLAELRHGATARSAAPVGMLERRAELEQCAIGCRVARERSVYIDAQGNALPCCWTAGELHSGRPAEQTIATLGDRVSSEERTTNALERGLAGVVNGALFQQALPASWGPGPLDTRRLRVCAEVCGGSERFEKQFVRQNTK